MNRDTINCQDHWTSHFKVKSIRKNYHMTDVDQRALLKSDGSRQEYYQTVKTDYLVLWYY